MNIKQRTAILFVLLIGLATSSCGVKQLLGSALTLTPTLTYTSTPSSTPTSTSTPAPTFTSTPTPTSTPMGGASYIVFALHKSAYQDLFPDLGGYVHLFVSDTEGKNLIPITRELKNYNRVLDVTPDRKHILVLSFNKNEPAYGELYTMGYDGSNPVQLPLLYSAMRDEGFMGEKRAFFIANGEKVVYIANDGGRDGIFIADLKDLFPSPRRISPQSINVVRLIHTPYSDKYVFWGEGDREESGISIRKSWWGILDGSKQDKLDNYPLAVSPDGLRFIADVSYHEYIITDIQDGNEIKLGMPQDSPIQEYSYDFFWSPDGQNLLIGGFDGNGYIYPYSWSTNTNIYTLLPIEANIEEPGMYWPPHASWSSDGKQIALTNGCQLLVINLEMETTKKILIPLCTYDMVTIPVTNVVWSPDNKLILLDRVLSPLILDPNTMELSQIPNVPVNSGSYYQDTLGMSGLGAFWVSP